MLKANASTPIIWHQYTGGLLWNCGPNGMNCICTCAPMLCYNVYLYTWISLVVWKVYRLGTCTCTLVSDYHPIELCYDFTLIPANFRAFPTVYRSLCSSVHLHWILKFVGIFPIVLRFSPLILANFRAFPTGHYSHSDGLYSLSSPHWWGQRTQWGRDGWWRGG